MNCTEIRLLLHAHVDGELDAANSLELEQHLKTCPACAAEYKSVQSLRNALRHGELNFTAPASLQRDVRQFVREMRDRNEAGKTSGFPWLWKLLAFGAAAFALFTLLLRPVGPSERDALLDQAVANHVRSLQVNHLTDVASSDQHTVKPWFDGKLDFAPGVKDFAEQGFLLVGGRLDYLQNRNVAALVYRRNKHLINVFIWPASGSASFETEQRRGFSIITGETNGMHFCLVSDLNSSELNNLASLVSK